MLIIDVFDTCHIFVQINYLKKKNPFVFLFSALLTIQAVDCTTCDAVRATALWSRGQTVPAEMMTAPHRGYSHLHLGTLLRVFCVLSMCLLCQRLVSHVCACLSQERLKKRASQAFPREAIIFFFKSFFVYLELFLVHW